MIRIFQLIIAGLVTDFALFPVVFSFFPVANSKMVLAAIGVILFLYDGMGKSGTQLKGLLQVAAFALAVSFIGFFSAIINGSDDYTYATYIVSMFVWCSSSYVAVRCMEWAEGRIDAGIVANYLICVCVAQCVLAMGVEHFGSVERIVNSLMVDNYAKSIDRLYGLGCDLDVAGTRFASSIVMAGFMLVHRMRESSDGVYLHVLFYLVSIAVFTVIGSMISRTSVIGLPFVLLYWISVSLSGSSLNFDGKKILWNSVGLVCIVAVTASVYLYNTNPDVKENMRFAFEGFFSLAEKGEWQTTSNDRLATMVVFPESLKTWIIGDGYFNNPLTENCYYIGPGIGDYYMNTDIGYLRFIFYFGLIGTLTFCAYMWKVASVCASRFHAYSLMFYMILGIAYVVWFKVSTDIFVIFSFFLMIPGGYDSSVQLSQNKSDGR